MKSLIRRRGASLLMIILILALAAFGLYFFLKSLREAREIEREMQAPPPAAVPENSSGSGKTPPAPAFPPDSGRVDYSWTLKGLDGKEIPLSRFKGKVVVLTFWATWCGYCRMEMPSIQKLYDAVDSDQIAFLMASSEGERPVRDYVAKNKYTLPFYLYSGNLPALFRTQGVPATFIIDKTGAIVRREVGARDWYADEIRQFLKKLA